MSVSTIFDILYLDIFGEGQPQFFIWVDGQSTSNDMGSIHLDGKVKVFPLLSEYVDGPFSALSVFEGYDIGVGVHALEAFDYWVVFVRL